MAKLKLYKVRVPMTCSGHRDDGWGQMSHESWTEEWDHFIPGNSKKQIIDYFKAKGKKVKVELMYELKQ